MSRLHPPSRCHRCLGRGALIGVLILAASLLTSCTLRESENYKVTTGRGVYLHLYGNPSWMLSDTLYRQYCKGLLVCTADFLDRNVEVSGWGAAEFHDGIRKYTSFRSAIESALTAGYASGWHSGAKCLVLHKSLTGNLSWSTEWIEPIQYNDDCWMGTTKL